MLLIVDRSRCRSELEKARLGGDPVAVVDKRDQLKEARRFATRSIKRDRLERDSELADKLVAADQRGDAREVYRLGRALQPYRRKPAVMISLEDGNPASDNKMARDRWFRHLKSSLKRAVLQQESLMSSQILRALEK